MAERPGPGLQLAITDQDHVQGAETSGVTLVEYGDFECPYSREAVKTVHTLQGEFGSHLRFVFRHFPLADKHPHAIQAAEAAEAAAAQGAFWPMYGLLFTHQWELQYGNLMDYAGRLGLDKTMFGDALKTHHYLERVRTDVGSGRRHGVTGTRPFSSMDIARKATTTSMR